MEYTRTPEQRFARLADYPFEPHYVDVEDNGMRMHYLDEGPADANLVLMLHGEPSWSYLYRHMIPVVAAAGHRVIVPDLIGFGKSDKPLALEDYSYQAHMHWMQRFIDSLQLTNITLVCQDWGSLIGLRLAAENPDRFAAIVVGNGMLHTGDQKVPAAFYLWKNFAIYSPWLPISRIVDVGSFKSWGRRSARPMTRRFRHPNSKPAPGPFPAFRPRHQRSAGADGDLAVFRTACSG